MINFKKLDQLYDLKKINIDILNSRITGIESQADHKITNHTVWSEKLTQKNNETLAREDERPPYTSTEKSGDESHLF